MKLTKHFELPTTTHDNEDKTVQSLVDFPSSVIVPPRLGGPYRPKNEESFDLCVKVSYSGEPLYVFIDNKSAKEPSDKEVPVLKTSVSELPGGGEQYSRMKAIMDEKKLPFFYLYASTHDDETSVVDGRAIYMGRTDTISMLGPLGPLCRMARSRYDLTKKDKTTKKKRKATTTTTKKKKTTNKK
jgi:hypothetical protein